MSIPQRAAACLLTALTLALAAPAAGQLRGAEDLSRVYDAILDADFARADRLLAAACPPAPAEACEVLAATRLAWEIQLDPEQTRLDPAFTTAVTKAIDDTEAWVKREPDNAEAWFYTGAAYGARVQWKVLRRQNISAARDGKRIKQALEEALRLDPAMHDAQFGLGLYEYYADVAPTAAKMFRWLLLLPGGDRTRGLARMQQARERGALLTDEAAYQIHLIDLWYEQKPEQAIALLKELVQRHETNPLFWRLLGETQDVYLHDRAGSLATFRTLLERARSHRVEFVDLAETMARIHLARLQDELGDTDLAVEELTRVLASKPDAPVDAAPRAQLALAEALDRIGERAEAVRLYRAVIANPPPAEAAEFATRARRGLSHPPDAARAQAYKLSLDAWRLFERGGSAVNAELMFERALAMDPRNTVGRVRYARVLVARKQDAQALAQLDTVLRPPPGGAAGGAAAGAAGGVPGNGGGVIAPPTLIADAAFLAGRLSEQAHDRDRATSYYRRAADTFGAAADTRAAATRALARLQR
jgi:tetratricopeptide (TPR) repeat protein